MRQCLLFLVFWKRLDLFLRLVVLPFLCGYLDLKNWKSGRLHRVTRHPKRSSWPHHQKKSRWLCAKDFVQWNRMECVAAFGEKKHKYTHMELVRKEGQLPRFQFEEFRTCEKKIPAAAAGLLEGLFRSLQVCLFVGKQIGAHCRPYRLGDSEKMVGLESWRTLCCCLGWRLCFLLRRWNYCILISCRRLC